VRESNANCRTHWAWITRTHLAAKALAEAKFASVLLTTHQIHLIHTNELLASSMKTKSSLRYLYSNTSLLLKQCCTLKRSYTHTQIIVLLS